MLNEFFAKCNMVRYTEFVFEKGGEDIKLPFYFHIKSINCSWLAENDENVLEFYSFDFSETHDNCSQIDENFKLLEFCDIKKFVIDEDLSEVEEIKEYKLNMVKVKNGYHFADHSSLYSFLLNCLNFSDIDFQMLRAFVKDKQYSLIRDFRDMLDKEMTIGSKKEEASESFMILRGAFELCNPPLFPENKGRTISEYSYRELLTQRVYLGRKCEIESIIYEKNSPKNKK